MVLQTYFHGFFNESPQFSNKKFIHKTVQCYPNQINKLWNKKIISENVSYYNFRIYLSDNIFDSIY